MILSHQHRFIYIKTRKTGSTSIEKALARFCGDDDVITRDRLYRGKGDVLADRARNQDGRWNPIRECLSARTPLEMARTTRDWVRRPKFYNHMAARSVRARIPPRVWSSYYKFTFERNPWDKCVSFYYWQFRRGTPTVPFNEYLTSLRGGMTADQALPTDWRRYAVGDRIIVDDVFDFGDLGGNLRRALSNTDLSGAEIDLSHVKGDIRKLDHVYSDDAHRIIERFFAREIEYFGYVCPDHLAGRADLAAGFGDRAGHG